MTISYAANLMLITGGKDAGTATSGSTTTLVDTSKAWTTNAWIDRTVWITGSTGVGQRRIVTSNTSNTLTIAPVWTSPDSTSTYIIAHNFADLAAANTTNAWGVVTTLGANVFSFTTAIRVGDGTTISFFADVDKQITINTYKTDSFGAYVIGYSMNVATGSAMTFGILNDVAKKITTRGCDFSFTDNGANVECMSAKGTANLELYTCKVHYIGNPHYLWHNGATTGGSIKLYNTITDTDVLCVAGLPVADIFNLTVSQSYQTNTIGLRTLGSVVNSSVYQSNLASMGADYSDSVSVRGLYTRGSANLGRFFFYSGASSVIDVDSDVYSVIWEGTDSGGTLSQKWSQNLSTKDGSGAALASANLGLFNNAGTTVFAATSDASGILTEQIVTEGTYRQSTASALASLNPHSLRIRKYGSQFILRARTINSPSVEAFALPTNSFIVASSATASAYTGVAINFVAKTITVSGTRTIQELYDYTQYQASLTTNLGYDEPITTTTGITFNLTSGWSLSITGNLSDVVKIVNGTLTVTSGGVFEDSTGAKWDVAGVIYYASRFTHNVSSGGSNIVGASLGYIDSGAVNKTYSLSRVAGSSTTDASGNASGYAVYRIGATTVATQTLTVRHYNYIPAQIPKTITGSAITDNVILISDSYVIATSATASAYTGIAINYVTPAITVTATHTIQELYDYAKYSFIQATNLIQPNRPLTTTDGINLAFLTNWSLITSGAISLTDTSKIISVSGTGTNTVASSALFEDKTGAKWDVAGVTYLGNAFALTVVDNGTSVVVVGAAVAFVDSTGNDRTYNTSRTQTGLTTNGSGVVSGYAVYKIGATSYVSQTLFIGQYSYQWLAIPKTLSGPAITETDRMSLDSFITLSKATADAATGITVTHATKIVDMGSNNLTLSQHYLKSKQASISNIETGKPGYMSYSLVNSYSDSGLLLRYDGSYYYGAYGWAYNNNGGGGTLKLRDSTGITTTVTSINLTGLVIGSRIQIYNTTTSAELYNAAAASTTAGVTFTHTGTDNGLRIRVRKADYIAYETTGIVTANGFTLNVSQVVDTIYNTIGIDGSTVTECSLSGGTLLIYINAAGATTSGQRIYAWYKYILATGTYIGLQPDDITAQTSTKFTLIGGLKIRNQNTVTPLNITGANLTPVTGNSTDVLDLSNGASIGINAFTVEGFAYSSGSGLSTAEHNVLFALPSATIIADTTLRRNSPNVEGSGTGDALNIRSLYGMIAQGTNKTSITGSTLSITKSDDTTVLGTRTLTTDATALPITGLDTV